MAVNLARAGVHPEARIGMRAAIADTVIEFGPWTTGLGRVFEQPYAFDAEPTPIYEARPWLAPADVLAAACNGRRGYFVARKRAAAFLAAHADVLVALHNAPFDLDVLHVLASRLDVYRFVAADRVWDTHLLHRIYCLATAGHTGPGKGQSTLKRCAELYLSVALPKDLAD
jgi:hypothetical protein